MIVNVNSPNVYSAKFGHTGLSMRIDLGRVETERTVWPQKRKLCTSNPN